MFTRFFKIISSSTNKTYLINDVLKEILEILKGLKKLIPEYFSNIIIKDEKI